ncbi:hypothetical protein EPUS_06909 [Endocarpon pusillum Z07020]|uniref:Major facilitator superfamily (MFS) profile domain-containing protein n=1 Tax=Endocarpon pusillum (strain Z07020 / HMAS-L-300199) TaxID=1263415 RepID=U1G7Y4_ENDPU|nr:uncharacterized protein EPUS_06909 [Endocarpon pusillum Z07020]ERF68098.1 hypothetical protein EPUS_06909 [Endocarpon pusillum Z07020]
MAFLDRVNIGNAAVYGLQRDLRLVGDDFNVALTVFFVPYVLFEIPSNIVLKRLKPHFWLSICMFLFGLVTLLQGFVQSFSGLIATRFFLGLAEAGVFPGCFYLISMWYKRSEAQKRYTLFFSSTQLAGAFGGLLASAIGNMNGLRGYNAWRWIFILEGLLTCVLSFATYFLISDFPEEAKWLTEEERVYIKERLRTEQGDSKADRRTTFRDIVEVFKDYKIVLGGLMYFALIVPAYGFAYFSPTIIRTYGYSPISTQLHSVPPFAVAFVFSVLIAFISDRLQHRFVFILIPLALGISGSAILLRVHNNVDAQYGALFLLAMGIYAAMPVVICWFTMNLQGHHARSVGTAWQIGFGNLGGIVAPFAFLSRDAPYYRTGYALLMSMICLAVVSAAAYFLALWRENQRPERIAKEELTRPEHVNRANLDGRLRHIL